MAFILVGTHPQLSLPHFDWSRENLTNVTKIDLPTLCNRNKQTSTQRLCDRNRQAHNVRATEIDNHAHHGKVGQPLMPNCDKQSLHIQAPVMPAPPPRLSGRGRGRKLGNNRLGTISR